MEYDTKELFNNENPNVFILGETNNNIYYIFKGKTNIYTLIYNKTKEIYLCTCKNIRLTDCYHIKILKEAKFEKKIGCKVCTNGITTNN